VGHDVGRGTIATILRQHGIEPAPERRKGTTWREFLKAHWEVLAAADFFTIEVWTATGLTRYVVLFVTDLATRRVHIAGITAEPNGAKSVSFSSFSRNTCDCRSATTNGARRETPIRFARSLGKSSRG
jgi:hypothetical protein